MNWLVFVLVGTDQSQVWDDPLPGFVMDLVVREFAEPVVIV